MRCRSLPLPSWMNKLGVAIASFLENAEMLADMGDLIAPSGTNAVSIYCRALALDPSSLKAREGIDVVADAHEKQPQIEAMENELKDTLADIEYCLTHHAPKQPGLLKLRKQIEQLYYRTKAFFEFRKRFPNRVMARQNNTLAQDQSPIGYRYPPLL